MRRWITAIALLAVAAIVLALTVFKSSSMDYRVAAIFDSAKGMVPGQQVKIAGAVVGSVDAVQLAAGPKARIVMSVRQQFAPFRANATCSILPEGLISENYVECEPGNGPTALPRATNGIPTISLHHTTVPVSVQDVLNTFSLPTDQRLGVLLSELGVGTAGRGSDLNALFLRTNPALAQSERVLSIVNAQRHELANALAQTDTVLSQLASNDQQLRAFVDRAATVATTTAQHRSALGAAVHQLPPMLDAVRPGLHALDRAAANAQPLLVDLRSAAPGLLTLTGQLPAFAHAGIPALHALSSAAQQGRPALRAALPVVSDLNTVSGPLVTLASGADQLLVSMRQSGAMEGFLHLFYILATIGSLYDNVSHILTFTAAVSVPCILAEHGTQNVPGCDHRYSAPGRGRIPVNDPSCGPVNSDWENQFCGGDLRGVPGGNGTLSRRPAGRRQTARKTTTYAQPVLPAGSAAAGPTTSAASASAPHAPPAQARGASAAVPSLGLLHSLLSYLLK